MEHMGHHALSVLVGGGQTPNLLSQCTYVSLKDPSPLGSLIPLTSQLSHLCSEPLNLGVVIPLKLTSVVTSLTKSTRLTSQTTFHSIKSLHHCEHGTHGEVITILGFCCTNLPGPSSCLLPRVSGGVAPRKDSNDRCCQLLGKTIHDIPQYSKGCSFSGFFSGPAS
jgi:hypothetical protein